MSLWSALLSYLRRGRGRPLAPLEAVQVRLYTRQGCHLCEEAHQCLEQARRQYRFTLEIVDVDTEPELAARHGSCVPVVLINGKVRFRGRVNAVLLARLLQKSKLQFWPR